MTTIANERGMEGVEIPNSILKLISLVLMALFLYGAVHLLGWAVNTKLANSNLAQTNNITAEFRERQLGCLAKNIYYEAGSEPFESKMGVAQVTINRTNSGKFPKDICSVIYQKNVVYEKVICQYSWVCSDVTKFRPVNQQAYDESMTVAKKALLEGFRLPSLTDALYYHATSISPNWNREKITVLGHHVFYK